MAGERLHVRDERPARIGHHDTDTRLDSGWLLRHLRVGCGSFRCRAIPERRHNRRGSDVYAGYQAASLSANVSGIPSGRTIYVRLLSWVNGGLVASDATYTSN